VNGEGKRQSQDLLEWGHRDRVWEEKKDQRCTADKGRTPPTEEDRAKKLSGGGGRAKV